MALTQEQIIEAFGTNPELVTGVLPTIQKSEAFNTLLNNKVDITYKEKIADEVKNIHGKYDQQFKDILGELPGTNEDGTKQKTYEFLGVKLNEYKTLKSKKAELEKDPAIAALNSTIAELKKNGGNEYLNNLLEQTKTAGKQRETDLLKQISDMTSSNDKFKKSSVIESAISKLKLNPDFDKPISDMIIENVKNHLLANSKFENDKLVFMGADGKPVLDTATMGEKTALQMLQDNDAVKSIILKDGGTPPQGGGAGRTVVGSIETQSVEGKGTTERLIIPAGTFKTQVEFMQLAESILQKDGVLKTDMRFNQLKDKAFAEHNVSKLPMK